MKKIAFTLLLLLVLVSCQKKEIVKNSSKDVAFAKNLAKEFYADLSNNDTIKIYSYLDEGMNKKEFKALLKNRNEKLGEFNRIDINRAETERINIEGLSEIEYKIEIVVYYKQVKCLETLGFKINNSKRALLFSYYLNPIP